MKALKLSMAASGLFLALVLVPNVVFANEEVVSSTVKDSVRARLDELEAKRQAAREARQQAIEDVREEVKQRFKQACENRQASYQSRLASIADRSERFIGVVDKILERVETFKETKNLGVPNYDTLLATVATKKLVVHDLQGAAKQKASEDFSCERDAAFESVQAFKEILHQMIDALKEYKTSVKDLIVAVKTAARTAEGDAPNESQ